MEFFMWMDLVYKFRQIPPPKVQCQTTLNIVSDEMNNSTWNLSVLVIVYRLTNVISCFAAFLTHCFLSTVEFRPNAQRNDECSKRPKRRQVILWIIKQSTSFRSLFLAFEWYDAVKMTTECAVHETLVDHRPPTCIDRSRFQGSLQSFRLKKDHQLLQFEIFPKIIDRRKPSPACMVWIKASETKVPCWSTFFGSLWSRPFLVLAFRYLCDDEWVAAWSFCWIHHLCEDEIIPRRSPNAQSSATILLIGVLPPALFYRSGRPNKLYSYCDHGTNSKVFRTTRFFSSSPYYSPSSWA